MSQMIKYRNRDKGVSIKLGNPMTESHGLDIDRKQTPVSHLLLSFILIKFCLVLVKFCISLLHQKSPTAI
jgi:hypothetical protein